MKKGFTLIELIVTMGLISLVGIVIVGNMTGLFSKEQDKQYEQFKETLENAACTYLDLNIGKSLLTTCQNNGSVEVPISLILGQGLIEESNLINPKNKAQIESTKNIHVSCQEGVKTCSFE